MKLFSPLSILPTPLSEVADRLVTMLGTKLSFVNLQPLNEEAITELVTHTLHIGSQAAQPLISALLRHSRGNAFTVRSLLMLLRNEDFVSRSTNPIQYISLICYSRLSSIGLVTRGRTMLIWSTSSSSRAHASTPTTLTQPSSYNIFSR